MVGILPRWLLNAYDGVEVRISFDAKQEPLSVIAFYVSSLSCEAVRHDGYLTLTRTYFLYIDDAEIGNRNKRGIRLP